MLSLKVNSVFFNKQKNCSETVKTTIIMYLNCILKLKNVEACKISWQSSLQCFNIKIFTVSRSIGSGTYGNLRSPKLIQSRGESLLVNMANFDSS